MLECKRRKEEQIVLLEEEPEHVPLVSQAEVTTIDESEFGIVDDDPYRYYQEEPEEEEEEHQDPFVPETMANDGYICSAMIISLEDPALIQLKIEKHAAFELENMEYKVVRKRNDYLLNLLSIHREYFFLTKAMGESTYNKHQVMNRLNQTMKTLFTTCIDVSKNYLTRASRPGQDVLVCGDGDGLTIREFYMNFLLQSGYIPEIKTEEVYSAISTAMKHVFWVNLRNTKGEPGEEDCIGFTHKKKDYKYPQGKKFIPLMALSKHVFIHSPKFDGFLPAGRTFTFLNVKAELFSLFDAFFCKRTPRATVFLKNFGNATILPSRFLGSEKNVIVLTENVLVQGTDVDRDSEQVRAQTEFTTEVQRSFFEDTEWSEVKEPLCRLAFHFPVTPTKPTPGQTEYKILNRSGFFKQVFCPLF